MNLLQTYGKELVALLVPLVTWVLNTFFKRKARLLWANPHAFTFLIQEPLKDAQGAVIQPAQNVHTGSYMLWNAGRDTATHELGEQPKNRSCTSIRGSCHGIKSQPYGSAAATRLADSQGVEGSFGLMESPLHRRQPHGWYMEIHWLPRVRHPIRFTYPGYRISKAT
jgi:hypothetical protein